MDDRRGNAYIERQLLRNKFWGLKLGSDLSRGVDKSNPKQTNKIVKSSDDEQIETK